MLSKASSQPEVGILVETKLTDQQTCQKFYCEIPAMRQSALVGLDNVPHVTSGLEGCLGETRKSPLLPP